MILLLFLMFRIFNGETSASNDMVFYNEQRILVEKAIEEEEQLGKIEEKYGCSIFLLTDKNYELEFDEALQAEALIFDYRKGSELKGKIVWNVEEKKYQKLTEKMFLLSAGVWGILFFAGYLFLAVLYVQFLRPYHAISKSYHWYLENYSIFPDRWQKETWIFHYPYRNIIFLVPLQKVLI